MKKIIIIQTITILLLLGYIFINSIWYKNWISVTNGTGTIILVEFVANENPIRVNFLGIDLYDSCEETQRDGFCLEEPDYGIEIQYRSPKLYMLKTWLIDKLMFIKVNGEEVDFKF